MYSYVVTGQWIQSCLAEFEEEKRRRGHCSFVLFLSNFCAVRSVPSLLRPHGFVMVRVRCPRLLLFGGRESAPMSQSDARLRAGNTLPTPKGVDSTVVQCTYVLCFKCALTCLPSFSKSRSSNCALVHDVVGPLLAYYGAGRTVVQYILHPSAYCTAWQRPCICLLLFSSSVAVGHQATQPRMFLSHFRR